MAESTMKSLAARVIPSAHARAHLTFLALIFLASLCLPALELLVPAAGAHAHDAAAEATIHQSEDGSLHIETIGNARVYINSVDVLDRLESAESDAASLRRDLASLASVVASLVDMCGKLLEMRVPIATRRRRQGVAPRALGLRTHQRRRQ